MGPKRLGEVTSPEGRGEAEGDVSRTKATNRILGKTSERLWTGEFLVSYHIFVFFFSFFFFWCVLEFLPSPHYYIYLFGEGAHVEVRNNLWESLAQFFFFVCLFHFEAGSHVTHSDLELHT